jgi:Glycosyltransferase
MRVLHVINNLIVGGAESLLVAMLPLIKKQVDVEVLLLVDTDSSLREKLKESNINILELSNRQLYNPLIILKLISILKNYSVVHVHLFPSMYYVAIAKLLGRSHVKLVFTEHSTSNRRLKSWLFRLMDRLIYLNYSKVICITPQVSKVLIDFGVNKDTLEIIYNGIDLDKFSNAERYNRGELGYDDRDIILVMVAAFRREKNHGLVIRSLSELGPRYKLMLVGDGYMRSQIESEVNELNLGDRVKFLGNRSDVERILKTCDIGVLSSHWEGFGLAAVEAMASGLPLVASDVPGLAEVVKGGGILFAADDVTDFINKIVSLEKKDYYNEVKESGIDKAKEYDLCKTASQLVQLYHVLNGQ